MASGDTKTESYLRVAAEGTRADLPSDTCCNTKTQNLILGVAERIMDVEDEVEELKNNPDVVDIVDTYADLQAYDTSHLSDNDIIRVLADETHSGNSTYYRFTKSSGTWTFIGEVVSGPTVVQTTGTSTTDVMSQNATTSMIFNDPSTQRHIKIGSGASLSLAANGAVTIGRNSRARGDTVSIGYGAGSTDSNRAFNVNIGASTACGSEHSVALGHSAKTTRNGEVNIGSGNNPYGYNNTTYRVLGGVHDPVDAHDAATKGYVDGLVGDVASALNIINNGGNNQ